MQRTIELIINPSELTAGTRGTSLGPGAMMVAARKQNDPFFGLFPIHTIPDFNHLLDRPSTTPYAKQIAGYSSVFHAIALKVKNCLDTEKFPVVIAGDHGSAAGTIAGIRSAHPNKRLGVIWIDAHGDIHSPYTTPSGNIHGMPLSLSLGDNNLECAKNEPDAITVEQWESLRSSFGIPAKILSTDLIFVGVRDTEPEENAIIQRLSIFNHTVEMVRHKGVSKLITEIEAQLAHCDIFYISFDVDSMDPDESSYGTGTPVKNGLSVEEATELVSLLTQHPKTVCVEIVEVNPCLDNKTNTMAEIAFRILANSLQPFHSEL